MEGELGWVGGGAQGDGTGKQQGDICSKAVGQDINKVVVTDGKYSHSALQCPLDYSQSALGGCHLLGALQAPTHLPLARS